MSKVETVEDLIAELAEHPLSNKVKVWICGDGVSVPIQAIERSVVDVGVVHLEIELK